MRSRVGTALATGLAALVPAAALAAGAPLAGGTAPLAPGAAGAVQVYVSGRPLVTDVPAQVVGGRTFLPVRAVAEALGLEVAWDGAARTVHLVDPRRPGFWQGPDLPLWPVDAPTAGGAAGAAGGAGPLAVPQVQAVPGQGLVALGPEGEAWRLAIPGLDPGPLAVAEGAAYLAYRDARGSWLVAVDAWTGDVLWRRPLPGPATALLPWGDALFVAHGTALAALAAGSGAPLAAWAGADHPGAAAGPDRTGADPGGAGAAGAVATVNLPAPALSLARQGDALVAALAGGATLRWAPRLPPGDIRLRLGGRLLYPDVAPFVLGGRVLVPVRLVAEALGARVTWDPAARAVYIDP